MKQGFAAILILGLIAATMILVGAFYLKQNKKPQSVVQTTVQLTPLPSTSSSETSSRQEAFFDKSLVVKSVPFENSSSQTKNLIVVRKFMDDARREYVDTYLTDENMSKNSAVKIDLLSDPTDGSPIHGLGSALPERVEFILSPDNGKRFIAVNYAVGDSYMLVLVDETGAAKDNMSKYACELVKKTNNLSDYACFINFDRWENPSSFYIKAVFRKGFTDDGPNFNVLIDANSGKTISKPIKL